MTILAVDPLVVAFRIAVGDASFALHYGPTDEAYRKARDTSHAAADRLSAVLAAARATAAASEVWSEAQRSGDGNERTAAGDALLQAAGTIVDALAAADGGR